MKNVLQDFVNIVCSFPGNTRNFMMGRLNGIPLVIGVLGLVLFWGISIASGFGSNSDQPSELPKPKLQTTPPIFKEWNFDSVPAEGKPPGFSTATAGQTPSAKWLVSGTASAPSQPHILTQSVACPGSPCFHLLLADNTQVDYFDLSVRLRSTSGSNGGGGLLYRSNDGNHFYAVLVSPDALSLEALRISHGEMTSLGQANLKHRQGDWHSLRIQRNTIISKEMIEVFFDNQLILSLSDQTIRGGQVGLVTTGTSTYGFDNLRVVELLASRPLSRPPAY